MTDRRLMHVVLSFPEHGPKNVPKTVPGEELQDQAEEFNMELSEYVSVVLIAALYGKLDGRDGRGGCLYEQIDWTWMKENKLCE